MLVDAAGPATSNTAIQCLAQPRDVGTSLNSLSELSDSSREMPSEDRCAETIHAWIQSTNSTTMGLGKGLDDLKSRDLDGSWTIQEFDLTQDWT